MAALRPASSHLSMRQQAMLLRKSLLLQMQFVLRLLQPAMLEPDVNSVTQGFWEGARVRMYLSVCWRKGGLRHSPEHHLRRR